jgi:UDP-N-acetylglucosamine 4,6-dehydratase
MLSDWITITVFENASFLVTGGTGSFGNAFVKNLLKSDIRSVTVFSRDEDKQHAQRMRLADDRVKFFLGDIRDKDAIDLALKEIDFVFHAAALKHVPPSEVHPSEFIKTNILGSSNLITSISESNVKKAIFLSTDKAVAPVNAMGMTKALMEKLVRSNTDLEHKTCITRYGNVIGSRGSVIPQFIESLRTKKEVTVTNPLMTRFLMSLSESVELVLHAMEHGDSGDLFVQKSPAATIVTIYSALAELMGIANPKVLTIGSRPGEKIHETLLTSEEKFFSSSSDKYFQVPKRNFMQNDSSSIWTGNTDEYNSANTKLLNVNELMNVFTHNDEISRLISGG